MTVNAVAMYKAADCCLRTDTGQTNRSVWICLCLVCPLWGCLSKSPCVASIQAAMRSSVQVRVDVDVLCQSGLRRNNEWVS